MFGRVVQHTKCTPDNFGGVVRDAKVTLAGGMVWLLHRYAVSLVQVHQFLSIDKCALLFSRKNYVSDILRNDITSRQTNVSRQIGTVIPGGVGVRSGLEHYYIVLVEHDVHNVDIIIFIFQMYSTHFII